MLQTTDALERNIWFGEYFYDCSESCWCEFRIRCLLPMSCVLIPWRGECCVWAFVLKEPSVETSLTSWSWSVSVVRCFSSCMWFGSNVFSSFFFFAGVVVIPKPSQLSQWNSSIATIFLLLWDPHHAAPASPLRTHWFSSSPFPFGSSVVPEARVRSERAESVRPWKGCTAATGFLWFLLFSQSIYLNSFVVFTLKCISLCCFVFCFFPLSRVFQACLRCGKSLNPGWKSSRLELSLLRKT